MKQKLESELVSIAYRILKLSGNEDVVKLHAEAGALYEALTVLKFAEENFDGNLPIIGNDSSFFGMLDSAFNNKVSDTIEVEDRLYVNLDETDRDEITEPAMNKIKDMLQHMPESNDDVEMVFEEAIPKTPVEKEDFEDITADFKDMPIFDPISSSQNDVSNRTKSLNEKIKAGGFNIGLNDKIAFIKHLFDGESDDYNRVISQLNTMNSLENIRDFIQNMVKPDYNNWSGKEEFEERFIEIIEAKFD